MKNLKIEIKKLKKKYVIYDDKTLWDILFGWNKKRKSKINAINGVDLNFSSNRIYGLFGKNGAGKSTLIKLICGIENPSEGSIKLNSSSIFGLIEENSYFENDISIYDNIKFTLQYFNVQKKNISTLISDIISYLNFDENQLSKLTKFFDKSTISEISMVSGLFCNPDIILIDENFNYISKNIKKKILVYLNKIKKDKIILIASHDLELLKNNCDEFVWLENGKVFKKSHNIKIFNEYVNSVFNFKNMEINFSLRNNENTKKRIFSSSESIYLDFNNSKKKLDKRDSFFEFIISLRSNNTLLTSIHFKKKIDIEITNLIKIPKLTLSSINYILEIKYRSLNSTSENYYMEELLFQVEHFDREDLNTNESMGSLIAPKIDWNLNVN